MLATRPTWRSIRWMCAAYWPRLPWVRTGARSCSPATKECAPWPSGPRRQTLTAEPGSCWLLIRWDCWSRNVPAAAEERVVVAVPEQAGAAERRAAAEGLEEPEALAERVEPAVKAAPEAQAVPGERAAKAGLPVEEVLRIPTI